jgi:hypothetical protein
MALLAEQIVEEWLNRRGYFTMRGIKHGVNEVDLLGIKNLNGKIVGVHVEVQVSVNPNAYISKLDETAMKKLGAKSKNSAKVRTNEILGVTVKQWVDKKFRNTKKRDVREQCWSGINWEYEFVHGKVKYALELDLIKNEGIKITPFSKVIDDLLNAETTIKGQSGTDFLDIISHYIDRTRISSREAVID